MHRQYTRLSAFARPIDRRASPPLGISSISVAGPAGAQNYPDRPVKIIVPFAAGGTADAVPRLIADWLSRKWGQPVIIENRTGAGGNIGAELAYRSRRTVTRCCPRRRRRW